MLPIGSLVTFMEVASRAFLLLSTMKEAVVRQMIFPLKRHFCCTAKMVSIENIWGVASLIGSERPQTYNIFR